MYTLEEIEYLNTITNRKGLLKDCMKPEFISKHIEILNSAITKANETPLRYNEKKWHIQVVKFPKQQDRDFVWRISPATYVFTVCDKYDYIFKRIIEIK